MENYLQRLVQRHVDPSVPTLQPRIASRFEQPFAAHSRIDQPMDIESIHNDPSPSARFHESPENVDSHVGRETSAEPLSPRPNISPTGLNEDFAARLSQAERVIRRFQMHGNQENNFGHNERRVSSVSLPSADDRSTSLQTARVFDELDNDSHIQSEMSNVARPSLEIQRELLQPTNVYNHFSNTTQILENKLEDREVVREMRSSFQGEVPLPRTPVEPRFVVENAKPSPRVPTMEGIANIVASKHSISAPVIATEHYSATEHTGNTVHVTIGRIEIRTPKKATEAPKPARPANASRIMSLDDYVRSRRGGRG